MGLWYKIHVFLKDVFLKLYQKIKDTSLKNKLLSTYLTVVIILTIILGTVSYTISSRIVIKQTEDYANLVIFQISKDIDNYIEKFERLTYTAYSNTSIQQVLKTNHDASFKEKQNFKEVVRQFILGISIVDKNIDGVYIYSKFGDLFYENLTSSFSRNYDFTREKWYEDISQGVTKSILLPPHIEQKDTSFDKKVNFSYIRALTDVQSGDYIGFIAVDININAIDDIAGSVGEKIRGRMLVLDETNRVIYISPKTTQVSDTDNLKQGIVMDVDGTLDKLKLKNVVITSQSKRTGWEVMFVTPVSQISKEVNKIRMYTIIAAIICVLLLSLISTFISMGISRPVNRLKKTILAVENGDLDVAVEIESNDEIGQLSKSFNKMVKNIKKLIKEVYEIQLKKKEAELSALQSQINPHFMYNTLESVNMMAILAGNLNISDILTAFANILRFNLDNKNNLISLDKEIKYVMDYIKIQQMRYSDKFDVILEFEPGLENYEILKLTIQPLVENAIVHGITEQQYKGGITLIIKKEDEKIRIIVKDNGVGLTAQRLEDVHKSLEREEALSKEGSIGLNNINERVRLYYGEDYGLVISSENGKGTIAEILIPARIHVKEKKHE